ncbi:hypothetical protein [Thalassotalea sp. ND16A]|uniref:hypothetical protein n=1 Tax=Thalassotalea sp. ND16A TaxID=1535422 RepID=UPI00051A40B8|nr:hypothetical protein [Thalassotalea sp. ND16A]KGJ98466.1 hypothetical protein ND16A_0655 [Thalassotalea sp. ND16A]
MNNNDKDSQQAERRNTLSNTQMLWTNLNSAQKVAASSLFYFGFRLIFIRKSDIDQIVGLLLEDKLATINAEGDINTRPDMCIRG